VAATIAAGSGFLDPCVYNVPEHYRTDSDGSIFPLSAPAKYTAQHLRLNRPQLKERRFRLGKELSDYMNTLARLADNRERVINLIRRDKDSAELMHWLLEIDADESLCIAKVRDHIFPSPLPT
jgi:hypothetical protein